MILEQYISLEYFSKKTFVLNPLDKLVASHSHLGYMPFNNDDFEAALSNINCQFMIVHTNNCVYIAEFESTAFANVDRIIKEVSKSYGEGLIRGKNHHEKETGKNVWENYKNNKVRKMTDQKK